MVRARRIVLSALLLVAALAAVNALLAAHVWIPERNPRIALLPDPAALAWLAVTLWYVLRSRRVKVARLLIAAILALALLYSLADALIEFFFDRPFDLAHDFSHIPGGLFLLFHGIDAIIGLLTALTIVVLVGAAFAVAVVAQLAIDAALASLIAALPVALRTRRVFMLGAPLFLLGASVVLGATNRSTGLGELLARTLVADLVRPAAEARTADGGTATSGDAAGTETGREDAGAPMPGPAAPAAEAHYALPGLHDRDVHLFFVESYGRTVFVNPELKDKLLPVLAQMQRTVEAAGYATASAFLSSPVTGGFSWMAEFSFLTGHTVSTQEEYDRLIGEALPNLPSMLRDEGYSTILAMPGTVHGDWPEATSFYHFDTVLFAPSFGYSGPMFSFVPIPDQFALGFVANLLESRETGSPRVPAFVQYVLVSSHAPFNRIPPYVPDWSTLGDGSGYREDEILTFDNHWFHGTQYDEGYAASIEYVLATLEHYVTEELADDPLIIMIGDHQPERPVRQDGASHSVPIHVLSRDRALVDAFIANGFVAGMIPNQPLPSPPTASFLSLFTRIAAGAP